MTSLPPLPLIVHQTWKTSEVPEHWKSSEASWRKVCQENGGEYRLWTDEDNRRLIETDYPWFLKDYDAYKYPIQRADAVRYFILHKYGGWYVDLDIEARPEQFIYMHRMYAASNCEAGFAQAKDGNEFYNQDHSNCMMFSRPGAQVWAQVWDQLRDPFRYNKWKRPLAAMSHYTHVMFRTGPGVVSDVARRHTKDRIATIPRDLVQPGIQLDVGKTADTEYPGSAVKLLPGSSWHKDGDDSGAKWGIWWKRNRFEFLFGLITGLVVTVVALLTYIRYVRAV